MSGEPDHPAPNAVEKIFTAALALQPGERTAYLDGACGDDQKLRQRVEALLHAHEAPESFLPQQPAASPTAFQRADALLRLGLSADPATAPGPANVPLLQQPGQKIGRYKLLQKIGEGGCGIVYMAEQSEPVKRRVALKIIKLGMDTRQVIGRFEAERQALALMDHPNIAKVLDAGATETGRPYFVMELVRGLKITDFCDEKNFSTRDRLDLFIQVCRAVQHAHQKGVMHRDIKPSNILVTVNDGVAVPKVIDFGIAKATNQQLLTDKTLFTAFEQFLGTPAYMSPEQAEMTSLDIDTRTDIYSLGVLLYELLTGKTPFDTQELLAAGLDEMRRTIREKEPVRPSTRLSQELVAADVRRLTSKSETQNPTTETDRASSRRLLQMKETARLMRGDLDWIVMKCLEKDRARRYDTANGLARDIERLLANEPIVARPPSAAYKLRKFIRRNQLLVASAALIAGALVLGVAASSWQAVKASRAEREQRRLREAELKARQEATENLWSAYLAEARGRRLSGQGGQRFESLAALSKAAAIRPSLELRNEAIACLALADIRLVSEKHFQRFQQRANVDAALERYALAEADGTVSIRRLSDDHELVRLPAVEGEERPRFPSFSQDGSSLALFSFDRRTSLWDLRTGKVKTEDGIRAWPSPDHKFLLTLESNTVAIHNVGRLHEANRFVIERPVSGVLAFRPDGHQAALIAEDRTNVLVFDIESGKTLPKLVHPMPVTSAAWHPHSDYLSTTCEDNLIYVWNAETGEKVRILQGHQGTPLSAKFSHDGRFLISAAWDGTMRLWDFETGRQLLSAPGGAVAFFGPDDHTLGAQFWDWEGFQLFDIALGAETRAIYDIQRAPGAPTGTAMFSANGRLLVYDTTNGATVYDAQAGREIGSITGPVSVFGFDTSGASILGVRWPGDGEGEVFRWGLGLRADGRRKTSRAIVLGGKTLGGIGCLSANGKVCAVIGQSRAQIFRTDTLVEAARTDTQRGMSASSLSPDGNLLATSPFHGFGVKVWDAHTGKLVKDLPTGEEEGAQVLFSPDGRRLVVGTVMQYQFWQVGAWSAGLRMTQQEGAIFAPAMTFSPNGKILAGTFAFRKVRLFSAATGEMLGDLEPPNPSTVTYLSFSPDGAQLAVCEGHSALRLWDLRSIREQLAKMGLDWDLPPYPTVDSAQAAGR